MILCVLSRGARMGAREKPREILPEIERLDRESSGEIYASSARARGHLTTLNTRFMLLSRACVLAPDGTFVLFRDPVVCTARARSKRAG